MLALDSTLGLILLLWAGYAASWIARASYEIGGVRFFALWDDAMISMRYGRNLARGLGLVWNPGEYVEGYTNPLWTLWMSLLHLLPLSLHIPSLLVLLTGAALQGATVVLTYRLAFEIGGRRGIATAAAGMTAFYYPLNVWALAEGLAALGLGVGGRGLGEREAAVDHDAKPPLRHGLRRETPRRLVHRRVEQRPAPEGGLGNRCRDRCLGVDGLGLKEVG